MPDPKQIEYKLKEIAELMVRDQGFTDGHWMVLVTFGHTAGNIETSENGPLSPGAISVIKSLGIQSIPQPNSISVDASQIGRKKPRRTTRAPKS